MTDDSPNKQPLIEWLAARYPESARKRLKEWFREGRVILDGKVALRFHEEVEDPGDRLQLETAGRKNEGGAVQVHSGLAIVYQDAHLVVVNKAQGLLSVPAPGRSEHSALELLSQHYKGKRSLRVQPVHRLDEYTSGLLVFALTPAARESLIEQVRSHGLVREYVAYVEGLPEPIKGSWIHHLRLGATGYRQQVSSKNDTRATQAIAHYEVEQVVRLPQFPGIPAAPRVVSRLRLRLETGLKHQIRIQANEAGFPLLGDRVYHAAYHKNAPALPGPLSLKRQALHAAGLGLRHPETGKRLHFTASLPEDLQQLEKWFRRAAVEIKEFRSAAQPD